MVRSGYQDVGDFDNWDYIRYRGRLASATRGKRGQKLLRDLLAALDAMPSKRLIADELVTEVGEVCALGCVAQARGISDIDNTDPEDHQGIAHALDVAEPLVREVAFENDEAWGHETPEDRWQRMRAWVAKQLKPEAGG